MACGPICSIMTTYVEFYRPKNAHRARYIGYEDHREAERFAEYKRSLGFVVRFVDFSEALSPDFVERISDDGFVIVAREDREGDQR